MRGNIGAQNKTKIQELAGVPSTPIISTNDKGWLRSRKVKPKSSFKKLDYTHKKKHHAIVGFTFLKLHFIPQTVFLKYPESLVIVKEKIAVPKCQEESYILIFNYILPTRRVFKAPNSTTSNAFSYNPQSHNISCLIQKQK